MTVPPGQNPGEGKRVLYGATCLSPTAMIRSKGPGMKASPLQVEGNLRLAQGYRRIGRGVAA